MKKERVALRNLRIFIAFMMAAMLAVCVCLSSAMAEGADHFTFAPNADGTGYVLTVYTGQEETVTVPDWYNRLPVVAIGDGAFQGNNAVKTVKLPSTVTVIGKAAFKNCTSLKTVTSYQAAEAPPAPARIPGDADDDGIVTMMDAIVILQYDVGWQVAINLSNADVDADGMVTMMDAILILQYDVGWNVVLQ